MKFIKYLVLLVIVSVISISNIQADTAFYYVYDTDDSVYEQFSSYDEARTFYDENKGSYNNLVLSDDSRILDMEYGTVVFKEGLNEYYSVKRQEKDMIDGLYGMDGLYLYREGDNVYFNLSGDMGRIDIDDVKLCPYEDKYVSSYFYVDDYLYHNIRGNTEGYYSYSLRLDKNVSGLINNHKYYSYDGHYFYDDFMTMADDYRNDERDDSVNYESVYYNYFQYLPYRTKTNYSAEDFEHYLKYEMKFMGMLNSYNDHNDDGSNDIVNRSQLYDVSKTLKSNETVNGTNALLVLASAINDSNFGKSKESFYKNSLFYNATYNNDFSRETGYFNRVDDSIDNYSHFTVNKYYANRRSSYYHGTYPGDKLGGLSVEYSSDPYYGERIASIAFDIDEVLGFKDRDNYALLFADSKNDLYENYDLDEYLYTLRNYQSIYPLLAVEDEVYKIQADQPNKDFTYNFEDNVAYISEDDVYFVLNEDRITEKEYKHVHVDFDGGYYQEKGTLDIKTVSENEIEYIIPEKEGYIFKSYSKTYDTENEVWNYVANYKKVESLSFYDGFDKVLNTGDYLDYKDSGIMVGYDNGDGEFIPLTSNILGYYENDYEHEENVYIEYAGLRQYSTIEVKDTESELYETLRNDLDNGAYGEAKKIVMNNDVYLSWNDIRKADEMLNVKNSRNYVMSMYDENADISVSGLDLSLPDRKTFSLIQDIYYLDFAKANEDSANTIANVAIAYGLKPLYGFDISYRFNYETINPQGPVVVQIKIDGKDINSIYSVYHLDTLGQVIKCKTAHTKDYVIFEADEDGTYLILYKESFNTFDFENGTENLKYTDTGVDEHRINIEFLLVMAIVLANFIGIAIYYIINSRKDEKWRDYKKLLLTQGSAQEGKRKS